MSSIVRLLQFLFQADSINLWRSDAMQMIRMILPAESAHELMVALGNLGVLQFKDLNSHKSASQRTYANQVKRCDEMERRLRFLATELENAGIVPPEDSSSPATFDFDAVEERLEQLENELRQLDVATEDLRRRKNEVTEMELLLSRAAPMFSAAQQDAAAESAAAAESSSRQADGGVEAPLLQGRDGRATMDPLGVIAGLVALDRAPAMQRLMIRATRGNVFVRTMGVGLVDDPLTGAAMQKSLFMVFYSGVHARAKIMKICDAYGANRYPFPEDLPHQQELLRDVQQRKADLTATLDSAVAQAAATLRQAAVHFRFWKGMAHREKLVYHTLNKCSGDVASKVLVAEAWCPVSAREQVTVALQTACLRTGAAPAGTVVQTLITHDMPPTRFTTDKFTAAFSDIVEAYGTARYQEANPTVFTIMTFPFLFAVMFGDAGHGTLMLLFALWLLINEKKMARQDLGDMLGMMFGGRYVILLMAIFSIYCGVIYNEFFSMPMTIFGPTHFKCSTGPADLDLRACSDEAHGGHIVFPPGSKPYPLGVDPIWHGTRSELSYLNSMKMKLSILLGVTQMNLGILHSLFNHLHFNDMLSVVCEFIPQMLFLNGLFGYLSFMIVYKWVTGKITDLYHVMIYMFLSPGTMDDAGRLFPGQEWLQPALLVICLVAVPWMLLPKPLILNARHKAHKAAQQGNGEYARLHDGAADDEAGGAAHPGDTVSAADAHGHGHGEFEFGEVMIHQVIHTIEFVLGAVSNTASYLRLWALSLAHSQLSAVFFDRVLMMTITLNSPFAMFIGFFVFAIATLGVLMVMESLSAFLHALRLHWVEFQNKFYAGDGFKFCPFAFDPVH